MRRYDACAAVRAVHAPATDLRCRVPCVFRAVPHAFAQVFCARAQPVPCPGQFARARIRSVRAPARQIAATEIRQSRARHSEHASQVGRFRRHNARSARDVVDILRTSSHAPRQPGQRGFNAHDRLVFQRSGSQNVPAHDLGAPSTILAEGDAAQYGGQVVDDLHRNGFSRLVQATNVRECMKIPLNRSLRKTTRRVYATHATRAPGYPDAL